MPATSRAETEDNVDLSIIIVSWNVWEQLHNCLASIDEISTAVGSRRFFGPPDQRRSLEVVVVDNGSQDETVSQLPHAFPWVTLIANQANLGFTAGNNQGYAHSRGHAVYFLNPDTVLDNARSGGDSLWTLYAPLLADAEIGLVGPQLRYADDSPQNSCRRYPTTLTGFFESTWLGNLWPGNPWSRRLHMADWQVDFRHDVDWLVGAAMMARRETLESVRMPAYAGPFDEGFFMYSEELDLCRRIKASGRRIVYVPEAMVIHHEGRSSEQVVAARHIHFNTSKVLYYRKVFGPIWAERLRRYLLLEFRWQLLQERVKWLLGHKRELRQARIDAYREVLADGLSPTAG